MGILDNLKEQADQDIRKQVKQQSSTEKSQSFYEHAITPKMKEVYLYLKELTQNLNIIEQSIKVTHYAKVFPDMGELQQTSYKINTDGSGGVVNHDKIQEVHFSFRYKGTTAGEYVHHTDNKLASDRIIDFLTNHKIPYTRADNLSSRNNGALNFYIEKDFPVTFVFSSNPEQASINLLIQNHENFEKRKLIIKPDDINEAYLDKLARYILKKDTELLDIEIDDDVKNKIRQRIEAEKKAKQVEQKSEGKAEQNKPPAGAKKSLFGKLFK